MASRRPPEATFARVALVAAVCGLAVYAVYTLAEVDHPQLDIAAGALYDGLIAVAALVCLSRAVGHREDRAAWALIALGLASWTIGDVLFQTVYDGAPPIPSVADAFYLGLYPPTAAAIALLLRSHVRDPRLWLDGLVAGLTLMAVLITLSFGPILDAAEGSTFAIVVTVAYPVAGAALLGMIVAALAMTGFHPGRQWALLGGGLALAAVAETAYIYLIAVGSYEAGSPVDILWPAGFLVVAYSAWSRAPEHDPARHPGWPTFGLAAISAVVGVAILVVDHYDRVPAAAVWLVAAAMAARIGRTAITFADMSRALRSSQVTAALVESTDIAIFRVSAAGVVETWNPGAAATFRIDANAAIGRGLGDLVAPGARDEMDRLLQAAATGETAGAEPVRLGHGDDVADLTFRVSPLRDQSGRTVGFTVFARDITERVNAARAERQNQAKSEFLSRMSHELRTPLNAVLGFGQLLALRNHDPEEQDEIDHILKAGDHLLELINETLEISHLESGRLALTIEPVALAPLVGDVVGLLAPLSGERGIVVGIEEGTLARSVAADRQRLKQVLLNLLSNAIKFNRDGGRVTIRSAELSGGRVAIAVSDTGVGIASADLPRLFSPFERLGPDAEGIEGSGLGLALSNGLMEAMGGSIDAVSEPGVGSTFTLELPGATAAAGAEPAREPLPSFGASHARGGDTRTVLCIEDNRSNLELMEQIFATLDDLDLVTAVDGTTGLDLARALRPDLVLLDLNLPDIQGAEVLRRLRADERTRSIPVIVVSADATTAQIDALLARGAFDYVTKPIDVGRLVGLLDDALLTAPAG